MAECVLDFAEINGTQYCRTRWVYAPTEYTVEKFRNGDTYWSRLNPVYHRKIIARIATEFPK